MRWILVIAFVISLFTANAQVTSAKDSITYEKKFLTHYFVQNDNYLSTSDLFKKLKPDIGHSKNFKKARQYYYASITTSSLGALMIGAILLYPVTANFETDDYIKSFFPSGAILMISSIPLRASFNKNARLAVDQYNHMISNPHKKSVSLVPGLKGVGIRLTF